MSQTSRPARWWEVPDEQQRQGKQGRLARAQGSLVGIECPKCHNAPVVYNGNYFCDNWTWPGPPVGPDECEWALAHPVRSKRDRDICDLIGIGYF